jgi:hypothetical protein
MHINYLALKGGSFKAGVETQATSTGTKATTGVGFKPSGLLLFGSNRAHSASADFTQMHLSSAPRTERTRVPSGGREQTT